MGIEVNCITEISQPEGLLKAIEQIGSSIVMTDKEAELLLRYLKDHDYTVGYAEGRLYRGDLDEVLGEIVWDEYTVDDLIDIVCEWNYEEILEMDAARQEPDDMVDFSNKHSKYECLKEEEKMLDNLFDQTMYRVGIDKLAEELADQFIQNLNAHDIGSSVDNLISEIKQPVISGKSR